jgi:hypothetical protein
VEGFAKTHISIMFSVLYSLGKSTSRVFEGRGNLCFLWDRRLRVDSMGICEIDFKGRTQDDAHDRQVVRFLDLGGKDEWVFL